MNAPNPIKAPYRMKNRAGFKNAALIVQLVTAWCEEHGGAHRMTLSDWRAAEQELKRRLHYE